jgi:hypothetical protein
MTTDSRNAPDIDLDAIATCGGSHRPPVDSSLGRVTPPAVKRWQISVSFARQKHKRYNLVRAITRQLLPKVPRINILGDIVSSRNPLAYQPGKIHGIV